MSQIKSRLIDLSFPTELLLEIIQHVSFDRTSICKLALVHPRWRAVLANYQCSIIKNLASRQLRHAFTDFPCDKKYITYSWLARCIRQYDVVDDVMAVLVSDLNCWPVAKHNMALTNTGLLLLYRLQTIDVYANKLAVIKSLPRDPLTAMFLAIHYTTLTARYHGSGIINQRRYGRFLDANQLELRNNVEFCFAEGALNIGPAFISDVLLQAGRADSMLMCLYHEYATNDWDTATIEGAFMPPVTQGPEQDPQTKPRTLFSTLLERMAELIQCPLQEVVGRIVEDVEVHDHSLAWLSLANKARLVQGLDVEYIDEVQGNCLSEA